MRSPVPRGVGSRPIAGAWDRPAGLWLGVPAPSVSILYLARRRRTSPGVPETVRRDGRARSAASSRARPSSPGYRLAPEHRYPAALDDAVAAYRMMLERGTEPRDVVLMGDSAGGGLALATAAAPSRRAGDPLPGRGGGAVAVGRPHVRRRGAMSASTAIDPMLTTTPTRVRRGGLPRRPRTRRRRARRRCSVTSPGCRRCCSRRPNDEVLLDDALTDADRAASAGVAVEVIQRYGCAPRLADAALGDARGEAGSRRDRRVPPEAPHRLDRHRRATSLSRRRDGRADDCDGLENR